MSIGQNSRNNFAAILRTINAAGQPVEPDHLDIRPHLVRTVHSDNTILTPKDGDNWSRISWRKLGSGRHYWIICDYSRIVDPLSELHPEERSTYLCGLSQDIQSGAPVSKLIAERVNRMQKGMKIRVQDMRPGGPSFDSTIVGVNAATREVTFAAVPPLAGFLRADTARILRLSKPVVQLTIPAVNRALFEAFDFKNPLATLVV